MIDRPGAAARGALAAALAAGLAVGCATQNLKPRTAAEMRGRVVTTAVVPDLQRLQQRAAPLLAALGMPIELAGLVAIVHPGAVTPVAALDRSMAMAMVVGRGDGQARVAVALHAASPTDARDIARAIEEIEPAEGETRRASDAEGTSVVTAPSPQDLAEAAAVARQAQSLPVQGDVVLTIFPDGAALSEQTDVRRGMDRFVTDSVAEDMAALPPTVPPAARAQAAHLSTMLYRTMADAVVDLERVEVALSLATGVEVSIRMIPRRGSAFAGTLAALRAVSFRPGWVSRNDPAMIGLVDLVPFRDLRERQARWWQQQGPGRPDVVGALERERQSTDQTLAFTVYSEGEQLALDALMALKPGTDARGLLDAHAESLRTGAIAAVDAATMGRPIPGGAPVREGDVLRLVTRPGTGAEGMLARAMAPGDVTCFIAVRDGTLVTTLGLDARARLDRVGTRPALPAGDLQAAVERAKGANGFIYGDVTRLLVPLLSAARRLPGGATAANLLSTIPGLAQQRLPVLVTWTGGEMLEFRATITRDPALAMAAFLRPMLAGGTFDLPRK